jgi:hypothetical protein
MSKNKLGNGHNTSYVRSIGRRIVVKSDLGKKHETLSKKLTKTKRTGSVAQVVKHLPWKCKAPEFNPSTIPQMYHFYRNEHRLEKTSSNPGRGIPSFFFISQTVTRNNRVRRVDFGDKFNIIYI